ncbi:MAG TPA: phosphatidylglycerophosphatase A, partial [Burkholderiaceae bacterium]|nr:phosphatidylglycerophosphatase A [Burkholderiaceae bacterium]
ALGFGSGLSPVAPGTAGTLLGWGLFLLLDRWLSPQAWACVLGIGFVVGWWACTHAARALGVADPSAVVWDEILAIWLILWLVMPVGLAGQAAAFGLFRLFDAVKRGPVGWADARFKGQPGVRPGAWQGFGILFDDLVAALCTLVVYALGVATWNLLHPNATTP